MKIWANPGVFILLSAVAVTAGGQTATVPAATPWSVVSRAADSEILAQTNYQASPTGQAVPQVHQVTRVASGLNYFDGTAWQPSDPVFQLSADGQSVYADKVQIPVRIMANLSQTNPVTITSPDGITLGATPVAIGLYNSFSGSSQIIGEITNCSGTLYGNDQVAFTNCFNGVSADVLFSLQKGSFRQDIVWEENINPADWGFPTSSNSTWIQIFTAINGPAPKEIARPIYVETDQSVRAQMASPDFIDHTLMFGQLKFGAGRTFSTTTTNTLQAAPIAKAIETINGQQYLVESVRFADIKAELQALPSRTARLKRHGRHRVEMADLSPKAKARGLENLQIPLPHSGVKAIFATRPGKNVLAEAVKTKGVHVDYIALPATEPDPMVFQGDETYFVDAPFDCDNAILEGGPVIKYPNNTSAYIEVDGNLACGSSDYLPAVVTAADDDSIGQSMSGLWTNYTGTVSGSQYGTYGLELLNGAALHDIRISYASTGIYSSGSVTATNVQIVGCAQGIGIDGDKSTNTFDNCLITGVPYGGYYGISDNGNASYAFNNCTLNGWAFLFFEGNTNSGPTFNSINSIYSEIGTEMYEQGFGSSALGAYFHLQTVGNNGFYDCAAFGTGSITTNKFPFHVVGGGSYYLTNGCVFRGAGTPDVDPALLADLAQKTTWAPFVFSNQVFSVTTNLNPQAARENTNAPDLGYGYYPLDYVFGGCDFESNVTVSAGSAVGWFQGNGQGLSGDGPYSIALDDSAVWSLNGTATQPCYYVNYAMVQEGGNGNWTGSGTFGSVVLNAYGSTPLAQISADFTKWIYCDAGGVLRDGGPEDSENGVGYFRNCEFYNIGMSSYDIVSLTFTNCLFFRDNLNFWTSPNLSFVNCTFYDGCLSMYRTSRVYWLIENSAFDGTMFAWQDSYNGRTNYTAIDYNAYNTNNFSWTNYPYSYPPTNGMLETNGPNTVDVTNFNWETSWFGTFYQPTNSSTFHAGSTTANSLGLYWFTTQTNQTIEGTNKVTIGYHYVATTGTNGNPLSMCGTNDYILYPDGPPTNLLQITSGPNDLTVTQGYNATFNVTISGGSFGYQWYWDAEPLPDGAGFSSSGTATLNLISLNPSQAGQYYIVVSNSSCSVTSTSATLTVVLVGVGTNYSYPEYPLNPVSYWNVTDISDPAQPVNIGELQAPYSKVDYQNGDFNGLDLPFPNTPWHTNTMTGITNAYGTTEFGGISNMGTVFEVGLTGGVANIYTFTNFNGAYPCSQLAISGSPYYGIPNTLYGTTMGGGSNGYGTVFKVNADSTGFNSLYEFAGTNDGEFPRAGLLIDGNTLYGTTSNSIFRINTDGSDFICLTNVTNASQLVLSLSGNTLYGTTTNGGANNLGMIFSVSTYGTNLTDLHDFTGAADDGALPISGLEILETTNEFGAGTTTDTLFGTTYSGGASNCGIVFSINTDGTGFNNVYDFTGTADGGNPVGGLLLTNINTLWGPGSKNILPYLCGTTSTGGAGSNGTIFALSLSPTSLQTLYSFGGTNGANPEGKLVLAGQTLYGTTAGGGPGASTNGTIFAFNPNDGSFMNLYSFAGKPGEGGTPVAGLSLPVVDNLWSVWSLDTSIDVSAGDLTNLFYSTAIDDSFALFANGALVGYYASDRDAQWLPLAPLTNLHAGANDIRVIIGGNGDGNDYATMLIKYAPNTVFTNLFGATSSGGGNFYGTVFEIAPSGYETNLYNFPSNSMDGKIPIGDLVLSGSTLYGVTEAGGTQGNGTIFRINTDGTRYTNLYSFGALPDGAGPFAGLIISGSTLYGTTEQGGSNSVYGATGLGTIFKINTDGSGYATLYSFAGNSYNDGAFPKAPLLLVGTSLYGTTSAGTNQGTIFRIATDGSEYTNIYIFGTAANDGSDCEAGLIASGTTLYGTTKSGGTDGFGTGQGTVFSFTLGSATDAVLHTFSNTPDGGNPKAGLLLLGNTLYGTTYGGGEWGLGTIFSISSNGTNYTVLRNLGEIDAYFGANPQYADLMTRSNFLYGTLSGGGSGYGMVFSINTNDGSFNDIHSFTGNPGGQPPDGADPQGGVCSP